ncbi:MAG TPA: hypothetical protein VNZ53_15550, partial [Steroidobacteraceae bacterium]|nr:hypothetical protein [Steroidobacteraceae bacterium]
VFPCANCGAPHGGTFGPYCPDCNKKSKDPNGGVPPNPDPPAWDNPDPGPQPGPHGSQPDNQNQNQQNQSWLGWTLLLALLLALLNSSTN